MDGTALPPPGGLMDQRKHKNDLLADVILGIFLHASFCSTAARALTAVDVLLIVDVHLHQLDQHARQDTQKVQVSTRLSHLGRDETRL